MANRKNELVFTPTRINNILPTSKNQLFYDANQAGLRLLITPTGNKSFQFQAWSKKHKKPLTQTLGKVGHITLDEARKEAARLLVDVNTGLDIENQKRNLIRARQLNPTVNEFSITFLERHCQSKNLRSTDEITRILNKDILPSIGRIKINEVQKSDIIALLDKIEDRNALTACNRTLSVLSKLFNFALERDVIKFPPTFGVRKRGVEIPRDRVLNDDEIRQLWLKLGDTATSSLIKFLLATGQRSSEARLMKPEDIEDKIWTIPASNTKNKTVHKIPIPELAEKIILELLPNRSGSDFVFQGKAGGALDPCSANHYLQRVVKKLGWPRTTIHDLRRTVKTNLGKLGISKHIKDETLNHEKRGMDRHYDHYEYLPEIGDALEKWNEYLSKLVI